MSETIPVPCEGSGCRGHDFGNMPGTAMCVMCGRDQRTDPLTGNVVDHQRDDLLARIERGDFG